MKKIAIAAIIFVSMIIYGCGGVNTKANNYSTIKKYGGSFIEPVTGMEFVYIPGGCFKIGAVDGDLDAENDEKPSKKVCVSGYYISTKEVTNRQYRLIFPDHNSGVFSGYSLDGDNQPAVFVSWKDSVQYASKLTDKSGILFDLPTEAEWEYAAKAGADTVYPWGNSSDQVCEFANVHDKEGAEKNILEWDAVSCSDGYNVSAPVGSYKPNKLGLYDMNGNVWEWVKDSYSADAYADFQEQDPFNPSATILKVLRGGSWFGRVVYSRSSNRDSEDMNSGFNRLGFRLVVRD